MLFVLIFIHQKITFYLVLYRESSDLPNNNIESLSFFQHASDWITRLYRHHGGTLLVGLAIFVTTVFMAIALFVLLRKHRKGVTKLADLKASDSFDFELTDDEEEVKIGEETDSIQSTEVWININIYLLLLKKQSQVWIFWKYLFLYFFTLYKTLYFNYYSIQNQLLFSKQKKKPNLFIFSLYFPFSPLIFGFLFFYLFTHIYLIIIIIIIINCFLLIN